jgi:hypothetical protein
MSLKGSERECSDPVMSPKGSERSLEYSDDDYGASATFQGASDFGSCKNPSSISPRSHRSDCSNGSAEQRGDPSWGSPGENDCLEDGTGRTAAYSDHFGTPQGHRTLEDSADFFAE